MKLTLIALILSPLAAVAIERPLHWTADIARVTPMQFDAMHGDALAFNVDFNASGKPVDLTGLDATLYWQTNGMESAWWSATGTVSNSTARALFPTPADPGSKTLNFFLGLTDGSNVVYGAAARVTFRNSPGATPNTIAPPVVTLDFAAIEVLHAPWATPDDVAAVRDDLLDYVPLDGDSTITGDITINGEVSIIGTGGLGVEGGLSVYSGSAALYGGIAIGPAGDQLIDGNRDGDKIIFGGHGQDGSNRSELQPDGSDVMTSNRVAAAISTLSDSIPTTTSNIVTKAYVEDLGISSEESDPTVPAWAKAASKPAYTAAEVGAATTEDVYRLVAGTNVVLVITNYNSEVHAPSMKLQRLDPETGEYVTYWDETRRHGLTLTNAMDYTDRATNELARTKADRAWGKYTSANGIDAPSDTLWISHPKTVFAPGLDWTREVTAGGEIFVLTSNGMALEFENNPTNAAYFNIASNGETIFRIEKTDSRQVYVNISDCQVVGNYLLVGFTGWMWPTHPLLRVKSDLSNDDWLKEEDAVDNAWAGVARFEWSGDGVNTPFVVSIENITGGEKIFAGFSYTAPGETKIINNGVTDLSGGVYHNGQKYVPTVSGDELKFIRQQ